MAWNVADLVIGVGALIAVPGVVFIGPAVVLGSLAIPSLARRAHVQPIAA